MAGQEVVRKGVRWRVGNGASIRVTGDAWLSDIHNPYVDTPLCESLADMKVSQLIDRRRHSWDIELLQSLFVERDVKEILATPLSWAESEDRVVWSWEESGLYSVRSAYRMMYLVEEGEDAEMWKKMWSMRVPGKVKIMVWRALTNCLPTNMRLQSRRVEVEEGYKVCHGEGEDVVHCLLDCSLAKECWRVGNVEFHRGEAMVFEEWWLSMARRWGREAMAEAAMICWAIWTNRNDVVWRRKGRNAGGVVSLCRNVFKDWRNAQAKCEEVVGERGLRSDHAGEVC